ncbi:Multiple RNA-binding domain-containing protein 1 [Lithohypha guttulata]|uniref:Multiple RNA-binding domain-containing protein 1 n=1 Tax=Lithohypha guttulata TaxID=1690604 RepID=UPI002DDF0FA3|nr:Multiple RNA-binding domain-containing protein 1 [Lithohypha guttulata]
MSQTSTQLQPAKVVAHDGVTAAAVEETTRVFVSGLPPNFTSDQLASHFGAQYKVTDSHVIADRRIGFVGFADPASAQNAARHFNKSYIRMSKIGVDLARPVEVSRDKQGNAVPLSQKRQRLGNEDENKKRKRSRADDGEHLRNGPSNEQQETLQKPQHDRRSQDTDTQQEDDAAPQPATDNDWLRGRTTRTLDLMDPDEVQMHQDDDNLYTETIQEEAANSQTQQEESKNSQVEISNARLFVRNLAFSVSEDDLQQRFSPFGKLQEVHVVKDARTSTSKGTAFLQFSEPREAEAALQQCDGITFHGRLMHILPASDKRDKGLNDYEISQMPLKKQKAVKRKLDAAKQTFSWNSLYMNPDAVMSSIADRLGVAKADILDPTSADAAIKQAHAETQLIEETKQYLFSAGVNTDAFKNKARDERCILLKNFPYGTTEGELRALLEPFGSLTRFLLPPAGTMALAQYNETFSASQALRHLSYKNIKGSVLYLEKAPHSILERQPTESGQHEPAVDQSNSTAGETSTVFVKNLNFSTTSARLKEISGSLAGFVSARVKTRTDAKRPGEVLSMGFGFLEFRSKEQAAAAVEALSGHSVDGHSLIVQLSTKSNDAGEETRQQDKKRKKEANQTKIIIKNLPFQISKKDIGSLFAQYGELKKIRVPRKFDNSTRGFAFAEFVTPKEAENAMEALGNTHLLGRRLVLEFAQGDNVDPEEEIRAIEKKVEQQSNRVHINSLKGPGRKKFSLDTARDDDLT